MPPKGSSHGRSAARAAQSASLAEQRTRSIAAPEPTVAILQELLALSENKVQLLEDRVIELESTLHHQRDLIAELSQALADEKDQSATLSAGLDAQIEHSEKLYKALRVKKRAWQRGQARKGVLEEQIQLLKSADIKMGVDLQRAKGNASKAVDALLKTERENSALRSELSRTMERCITEAALAQQKLTQACNKMKEHKKLSEKLKKHCDRAATVRANALKRATDRVKKESAVHKLLHKGVFTEKTRNLIRLLVRAGCSRAYVGEVIHAVFETASISVHGNISRRTVSRIVLEGYFAANMQLGYEMAEAKSECLCCILVFCSNSCLTNWF